MVKEVVNRPDNRPQLETEAVSEFIGSAPELSAAKLGGGLMRECVNMDIHKNKLVSREKFKLWLDNKLRFAYEGGERYEKFFFTLPYEGKLRRFWFISSQEKINSHIMYKEADSMYEEADSGAWDIIYTFSSLEELENRTANIDYSGYVNPETTEVFRYAANLWILHSFTDGKHYSYVISNEKEVSVRRLGTPTDNITFPHYKTYKYFTTQDYEKVIFNRWCGFDLIEKNEEDVIVRSSSVQRYNNALVSGTVHFDIARFSERITHVRFWLSELDSKEIYGSERKSSIIKMDGNYVGTKEILYPMVEIPIGDFDYESHEYKNNSGEYVFKLSYENTVETSSSKSARKGFIIEWEESEEYDEVSFSALDKPTLDDASLVELEPMPNAICFWDGRLWGIDPKYNRPIYSMISSVLEREQTKATATVTDLNIGIIYRLEPSISWLVAFGSKGIAIINNNFTSQTISLYSVSSNAKYTNLSGVGIMVFDQNKFLFLAEGALNIQKNFDIGESFLGISMTEYFGYMANHFKVAKVVDNKVYIISCGRLFVINLGEGTGVSEIILIKGEVLTPLAVEAAGNGQVLFVYSSHNDTDFPIVLAFDEGEPFEEDTRYYATFYSSSVNGFIEHLDCSVFAKIQEGQAIGTETICDGLLGSPLSIAMNSKGPDTDKYWEYRVPTNKANGNRVIGKTVGVRVFIQPQNQNHENDDIEIHSLKFTRMRQNEVFNRNFNPSGVRSSEMYLTTETLDKILAE